LPNVGNNIIGDSLLNFTISTPMISLISNDLAKERAIKRQATSSNLNVFLNQG
jgi:hypothetical protein